MYNVKLFFYKLLLIAGLFISSTASAQIYDLNLDSLWNVVRSPESEDTLKVDALSKIASQYYNTFPDSTIFFVKQSITLSQSIGYKKGTAKGYMNLGAIASFQGNINSAAEYTIKALEIIEQTNYTEFHIQILLNLAVLMQENDQLDRAEEYAQEAYELSRKTNNIASQINSSSTLASFKASRDNCIDAIDDYYKALNIAEENNITGTEYFYTLAGLADCYEQIYQNYDSSIVWFNKMNQARKQLNSSDINISYFNSRARYALRFEKYEEAEAFADSALIYTKNLHSKSSLVDYYFLKSDIYKGQGLYKSAYENYKIAIQHQNSLQAENKEEKLLAIERKYNSEKKGKELLIKRAELEKQQLEIKSQKNQKLILMVIFGLGTIFTWFVIFSFLKNRKKNKLLKTQNEELEKLSIVAKEIDSAVIITDSTGTIEWINEGILDMYELTQDEVNQRIGTNIIDSSNFQGIKTTIEECKNTKKSSFYTSKHFKKNGTVLWVQTTLTPILNQNGEVNKIVFIDTNVSTVKKSEVQLSKQKKLLETKNNQITDSFNYAKQIQQAVLPSDQTLSSVWQDHFALLNPKC